MKRFGKGKFKILASLVLSCFGVGVAAISTYAWFAVTGVTKSAGNNGGISSSSDLSIKRIKGFKYEYDEPEKGQIDYSSGEVTSVTTFDELGDVDVSEEMEQVAFDIPKDGTGYYLMGDEDFVSTLMPNEADPSKYEYKFAASLKLIREESRSSMYYRKDFTVAAAGEKVRIKNHYFSNAAGHVGDTVNDYITFTGTATDSTSFTNETVNGDNVTTITFASAGKYSIWYETALNKLAVEEASGASSKNKASRAQPRRVAANGDTSKIYLNAAGGYNWGQSGAWFRVNFKGTNDAQIGNAVNMNRIDNGDYWEATIPSGTLKFQILRMRANTDSTQDNYSGLISLSTENRGRAFYINGWNDTTNVGWHDYWVDGFYVVGYGGVFGTSNSWKASTGYYVPSITDNTYSNGTEITFQGGEYWSLVYRKNNTDYGSASSYPDKRGYYSGCCSIDDGSYVEDGNNYQVHNKDKSFSCIVYRIKNEAASHARDVYIQIAHNITLCPSYFLSSTDGSTRLSIPETSTTYGGTPISNICFYLPSGSSFDAGGRTFNPCQYWDPDNAIWYVFKREGTTWYNDARCRAQDAYSGNPDDAITLYAKMVAKPLTTFYVDVKAVSWSNCYITTWDQQNATLVSRGKGTEGISLPKANNVGGKALISGALYRFTLPTTAVSGSYEQLDENHRADDYLGFYIHNGGNSATDQTTNVYTFGQYLRVETSTGTGGKRNWNYDSDHTETHGKLYVSRKANNYVGEEQYKMGYATTSNWVAMEEGIILYEGDVLAVNYEVSSSYWHDALNASYSYAEDNISGVKTFTDENSHSSTYVVRIKTTGRYTVYLTRSNNKVAIAEVPLDGNGYYVMTTSSSSTHTGFANGHKMKAISGEHTNIAYLKNLYVDDPAHTYIYVRSYNDNVDVLYQGHHNDETTDLDSVLLSTVTDCQSPGYFNVWLYKTGDVTHYSVVATDETDTFFNMNSFSPHAGTLLSQGTSMILEVSFTAMCVDAMSISLDVTNTFTNLGVNFYASASRLTHPWEFLVKDNSLESTYHANLQSGSRNITSSLNTTAKDNEKIYYGYILIDYLNLSVRPSPNGTLSFRLKGQQVVG